jgi:guanylate kinase
LEKDILEDRMKTQILPTKGTLIIIAAPSGGGKTSLVNALLETDLQLKLSVSHTTRPPRPNEIEGEHYFFVSIDEFDAMLKRNVFLEHATVFEYCYGTSSEQVLKALQDGLDVILEIDWQGAQQVRKLFSNVVSIFILPPSIEALASRLVQRNQDSDEIILMRMQKAKDEISHCHEFDFIVFNDDFDHCLKEMREIIMVQRLRYSQQSWRNREKLAILGKS